MFILVRHAHAGDRERRRSRGPERPLSVRGHQQARGLVRALAALDSLRLVSSPHLRCRQTLEPLAEHLGQTVESSPLLSPHAGLAVLDGALTDPAWQGAVACRPRRFQRQGTPCHRKARDEARLAPRPRRFQQQSRPCC